MKYARGGCTKFGWGSGRSKRSPGADVYGDMSRRPRLTERRRTEETRNVPVDESLAEFTVEQGHRRLQIFEQERAEESRSPDLVEICVPTYVTPPAFTRGAATANHGMAGT